MPAQPRDPEPPHDQHQHRGDPARAYEFYQAVDKLDPKAPEQSRAKLAALGFSLEEISAFIQEGKPSQIRCDYEDGLRTLDVTLAANESARTGQPQRTYFSQHE